MRVLLLLFLFCTSVGAQTVSYWFQGWETKPDAKQAAAYFMVPGANVTFTYQTNRVIINSSGGGGGNLQLFGDVTSPLSPLPNVTATLATLGAGGVNTKITYNTKGLVTASSAAVLASADFANQGTTTTVLHGNAAGNPSWGQVSLSSDVTGVLPSINIDPVLTNQVYATNIIGTLSSVLDIRTNQFNQFTGTNQFDLDVMVNRRLGLNFTMSDFNSLAGFSYNLGWKLTAPTYFFMQPSPYYNSFPYAGVMPDGPTLSSWGGAPGTGAQSLSILGSPLFLGTYASYSIFFINHGDHVGQMGRNLYLGKGNLYTPSDVFGPTGFGGIYCTNFIYCGAYVKSTNGTVVTSNSWTAVPTYVVPGSSDVFRNGDNWYVSSNGYPCVVFKLDNGTLHTNMIFADTNVWSTSGNKLGGTGPFLGSTDNQQLQFKVNNAQVGLFKTDNSIALGPTASSSSGGVSIGNAASANFSDAVAIGTGATGSSGNAIAIGSTASSAHVASICIGANALANADNAIAIGTSADAEGVSSVCIGGFQAGGVFSFAAGNTAFAVNDGSFVWSDNTAAAYTDTGANQFVVYASGGVDLHAAGAGVKTDGPFDSDNTVNSKNTGSVVPYTYYASNNGNRGPAGQMPLGCWGCLSAYGTATRVNGGAAVTQSVYYPITNFTYSVTNHFVAHPNPSTLQSGWITNVFAGYYRINFQVSAAAASSDQLEADVSTNNVTTDVIAAHDTTGTGSAKTTSMSGSGILYLPAGTYIGIKIQNISSTAAIVVDHAQLTVGSP